MCVIITHPVKVIQYLHSFLPSPELDYFTNYQGIIIVTFRGHFRRNIQRPVPG